VLKPYLIGDDLNSDPAQRPSRFIINFRDWPLSRPDKISAGECAEDYPELLKIVDERVKPQRLKLPENNSTAKHRRNFWWQFSNRADDLLASIYGKNRVLAISRTTAHLAFAFVATDIVLSERLVVISEHTFASYCLLQSSVHEAWAFRPGTMTQGTTKTYFVAEAFETFPRPNENITMETCGEKNYTHRDTVMSVRQEGLTKIYNRFHDHTETSVDIVELRRLHVEMDRAVATAYGWQDLDLGNAFHETKQGIRYTISESARREVLDRMLALNHKRHAEEEAEKASLPVMAIAKRGRKKSVNHLTPGLFD
jgi:hypothetical protein